MNGIKGVREEPGATVVELEGKIDITNFAYIQEFAQEKIGESDKDEFIFDMKDVTYTSSAGLRMFNAVSIVASESGKSYKLIRLRKDIEKMFQMIGYASAFRIESEEEDENN